MANFVGNSGSFSGLQGQLRAEKEAALAAERKILEEVRAKVEAEMAKLAPPKEEVVLEEEKVEVKIDPENPEVVKLEALPDADLKDLAKKNGVPGFGAMKRETLLKKLIDLGITE